VYRIVPYCTVIKFSDDGMRNYPEKTDYGYEETMQDIKRMEAEEWMLDALKLNNCYNPWGNFEDHMSSKSEGWGSPVEIDRVSELWKLDSCNEVVSFYFDVDAEGEECPKCDDGGEVNGKTCSQCEGEGYFYTDKATLRLQLWILHPRKGASRGVYLKEIKRSELSKVVSYLLEASERNQERFSKLKDFKND